MDKKVLIVLGVILIAIIVTFLIVKGNIDNANTKLVDEEEVITDYKKLTCTEVGHDDILGKLFAYSFENNRLRRIFRNITYVDKETASNIADGVVLQENGVNCRLVENVIECEFDVKILSDETKAKYELIDQYYDDFDGLKNYLTTEKELKCEN